MTNPAHLSVCLLAGICLAQQPAANDETVVLSGRVVDLRGEGIPVAEVWIADPDDDTRRIARTNTDAEGFFRLSRVPAGSGWWVQATADGYSIGGDHASSASDIARIEVHDGTTVRGLVRGATGQPVAGVIVSSAPAGRALSRTAIIAKTDAEGRFELSKVPLGLAQMGAWVPGAGLAELRHRVVGDDQVELLASKTATTSFQITVDGLPEADAPRVELAWAPYRDGNYTQLPPPFARPVIEGGKWQADSLPDWRYDVQLRATGYAFQPDRIVVKPGSGPHQLGFVATRTGTTDLLCRASVTDPDGKPVAGVTFVMRKSNGGDRATASSDDEGKLTFQSPLAAGTKVIVYATDDDWVIDQPKTAEMTGSHDRRFLEDHECLVDPQQLLQLRVVKASSVSGRLLHADGRPAAFVGLELQESDADRMPLWMTFTRTTSDRDGNYRFRRLHHSPDDVRVLVEVADGTATSEPFDIAEVGKRVVVPELKLAPPAAISGVVKDGNGKPMPGLAVWLRDWDMAARNQRSGSVTEVITDREGRFRFLGVPVGGAWLQLIEDEDHSKFEKAVAPFEVEPGQTYTFELQKDG